MLLNRLVGHQTAGVEGARKVPADICGQGEWHPRIRVKGPQRICRSVRRSVLAVIILFIILI